MFEISGQVSKERKKEEKRKKTEKAGEVTKLDLW